MPSGEALIILKWCTCKPFYSEIFYPLIFTAANFDVDMFICGNFV